MKSFLKNNIITILLAIIGMCCTALISLDVQRNLTNKNIVVKEIKKK